jgi:hypothetical protein
MVPGEGFESPTFGDAKISGAGAEWFKASQDEVQEIYQFIEQPQEG